MRGGKPIFFAGHKPNKTSEAFKGFFPFRKTPPCRLTPKNFIAAAVVWSWHGINAARVKRVALQNPEKGQTGAF